ncbi:MAG: triose-phosphate isomerase, partial [Gammaproteobacteria bacterium]
MTQRRPLVAANWKMNGTLGTIKPLLHTIQDGINEGCNTEMVICPPFVYLPDIAAQLQGKEIALGAQNLSEHESGAFTGEVSAIMLKDYNCRFVIVGHSERRTLYGETDEQIAGKFAAAGA